MTVAYAGVHGLLRANVRSRPHPRHRPPRDRRLRQERLARGQDPLGRSLASRPTVPRSRRRAGPISVNGGSPPLLNVCDEDFRPIGDANGDSAVGDVRLLRPFKISLEDGKGQGSVQVTFHEIIPNQPINVSELGHV